MNEIERFKKSRMIPKGQNGLQVGTKGKRGAYPVEYTNRGWIYSNTGNPVTQKDIPSIVIDKPNPPQTRRKGLGTTGETPAAINFTPLFTAPWNTPAASTDQAVQETPTEENIFPYRSVEDKRASEQQARQYTGTSGRTGGRVRSTVRRPKFVSRLGDLNLTAEEKDILAQHGVTDFNDAMQIQNAMLALSPNANLGARKGAGIADGYFGDKSLKAFQALRNQGIFTPKIDAQETPAPVVEQPVDAPDFGYATNQDYSDGSQFKRLGFNNYQGLLLYAQNSQDQFAKDLRERFRDKLTDQNFVESQLGISGKYRGGNAGDFGDIARSMQEWKTGVNNDFDKRRAEYAQARLAERTGSDGTVYSSPEMMKKFDGINVSPGIKFGRNKLDFSNMQFNVNFGNMGANTLGNIGTLGNTGLS